MEKQSIIRNKTEKSATDSEMAYISQKKIKDGKKPLLKEHLF